VVKRAFKYRFYPSPEQAGLLDRTFGSVRYVYNRALAERSRAWTQERRRVTFAETCRMLVRNHTLARAISDASWSEFPQAAGVQGGLVRADRDRGGQVLPEQQDMLGVRCDHREDAAERPGVGVRRLRHASRPGRERGEGHTCGGALRSSLRRWCQTFPRVAREGDHL
jgi:Helix-turn-helix domain